jgi:hypothetical protein
VWDAGEPGLAGWTIQAWQSGSLAASTTTDGTGFYQFNLLPGTYTFKEVCPSGWRQSVPGPITSAAGCGTNTITETLVLGVPSHDNNFGNFQNATKTGLKFEDLNGDGGWDVGEPGVAGWAIHLFGTDGAGAAVHLTTVTDGTGAYSFSVSPGSYTVCEADAANWTQSYPGSGANCTGHTDGGTFTPAPIGYAITLTSGQVDSGNDFGNFRNATKTGTKFSDLNGNGVWDTGEPGLMGWSIHLFGTDGLGNAVHQTTTTNASGVYSFSVAPGSYTVCEVMVADWTQTYPTALTPGAVDCSTHTDGGTVTPGAWGWGITLTSNQTDSGNNFGNQPPPFEGCTPGYWKTHTASWVGYTPGQTLESVFDVPDSYGLDNHTLLHALDFGGGPGTVGAAKTLLRAAVAALLNASSPDVNYEYTTAQVIAQVNAALASGSRTTMLALASELDSANNAGCPIS